jgi:hypothetical protein
MDVEVLGIIITSKEAETLKGAFTALLHCYDYLLEPKTLVIDSDPLILEAAHKVFPCSKIIFS